VSTWALALNGNYLLDQLLPAVVPDAARLALSLAAFPIAGSFVTRVAVRPLGRVWQVKLAPAAEPLRLGAACVVTSRRVDEEFGTAEVRTDGAPVLIAVRARAGEALAAGDEAEVYEIDRDRQIYYVTRKSA
jgi:hypothetical protein